MIGLIQVLIVKMAALGVLGADLPTTHFYASQADSTCVLETPSAAPTAPEIPAKSVRFPRPEHLRGIYVNAWAAGNTERLDRLLRLAAATEVNTFVIDLKDIKGHLSATSGVPLAQEIGADSVIRIPNIRHMLAKLEAAGVYPIARITAFKDPLLASQKRELMLRTVDGRTKRLWVNPYLPATREYLHDVSREAAALGFPAVQWDYVRFPVTQLTEAEKTARKNGITNEYVGSDGRSRQAIIREFLVESRAVLAPLGVSVQADLFAQSILVDDDVGIGQHWESLVDVVDYVVPMIYPSHYGPGAMGLENPNANPYSVVHRSLRWANERSEKVPGAGQVIPFLQAFTRGKPAYGTKEIRDQIRAAKDAGVNEWFLWHPGSQYSRWTFRQTPPEASAPKHDHDGLPADAPSASAPRPPLVGIGIGTGTGTGAPALKAAGPDESDVDGASEGGSIIPKKTRAGP